MFGWLGTGTAPALRLRRTRRPLPPPLGQWHPQPAPGPSRHRATLLPQPAGHLGSWQGRLPRGRGRPASRRQTSRPAGSALLLRPSGRRTQCACKGCAGLFRARPRAGPRPRVLQQSCVSVFGWLCIMAMGVPTSSKLSTRAATVAVSAGLRVWRDRLIDVDAWLIHTYGYRLPL